jgi:hypothetical protein
MRCRALLPVTLLLLACGSDPKANEVDQAEDTLGTPNATDYNVVFDTNVVTIDGGQEEAIQAMPDPCTIFKHEYVGLYPITDTLPYITDDSTIFSSELRRRGFHNIHSGHGNWQDGPRIILVVLANEACTCAVTKLYHTYGEPRADSTYAMKVTERVFCNTEP